jgi:hypothetical protein
VTFAGAVSFFNFAKPKSSSLLPDLVSAVRDAFAVRFVQGVCYFDRILQYLRERQRTFLQTLS